MTYYINIASTTKEKLQKSMKIYFEIQSLPTQEFEICTITIKKRPHERLVYLKITILWNIIDARV